MSVAHSIYLKTKLHSIKKVLFSYPQSGAGHQRTSGSETRTRRTMKSSYLSIRLWFCRMFRMSLGWYFSVHSGQEMFIRLSVISIFRYVCRQVLQERWWHVMISGKSSTGLSIKHSGHSLIPEAEMTGRCSVSGTVWTDLLIKWTEWAGSRSEDAGLRLISDLPESESKLIRDLDFPVLTPG